MSNRQRRAEKIERKKQTMILARAVREELVRRFPSCFRPKGEDKPPLKVGIFEDIRRLAPDISIKLLRIALYDYTYGPTYLVNIVEGARRIDLNGNAAGLVTLDAEIDAARKLAYRWGSGWVIMRERSAVSEATAA